MAESPLNSIEIRDAFRQPLPPLEVTRGYRARLTAVLAGLVLLQALYLLLIGIVSALTVLYVLAAFGSGITPNALTIAVYLSPPAAGAIVILFLLKPLIIRPPRPPQPLQLSREKEPVLFEFIDRLCNSLGSPRPSRIFVDLQANAFASVRGWRGFFFGQMDLTIGLPLAAGLTLPQFTGVLAHEFGHFSQRTGLRSYFLIESIRHWFSRVVHQRDKMDHWLDRQRQRRDWRIKAIAYTATFAVTWSRKYLTLLTKAGAWISAGFSRQMELDADRCETAIVGCEIFEQTSQQLPLLAIGMNLAWEDVSKDWSVGMLPEDVPHLALTHRDLLDPGFSTKVLNAENSKATGRWDTHPCLADRIANSRATGFHRAFHQEGAAARLFRDLPALCREATLHHYEKVLEIKNGAAQLIPSADAVFNAQIERDYEAAVQLLFSANPRFCARWFRLSSAEPRLVDQPSQQTEAKFDANAYDAALHTNLLHFAALTLRQSGVAVNPSSFRVPAADFETVRHQESISTRNMNLAMEENRRLAVPIAARIENTLARVLSHELLLAIPENRTSSLPDILAAWKSYVALSQYQDEVMEVRRYSFAVRIVRENARIISAAACANLLDDLENGAIAAIDKIVSNASDVPVTLSFDPSRPATVKGQLECARRSREDRIRTFLARIDVLLPRTLGELVWVTLAACPAEEGESSAEAAG